MHTFRNEHYFWAAIVFQFCLAVVVMFPHQAVSIQENRLLSPAPHWDGSLYTLASLPAQFSSFFNDRFGLRNELGVINSQLNLELGHTDHPGILVGKDGWLFLNNLNAIPAYTGERRLSEKQQHDWIAYFRSTNEWFAKQRILYYVVVVPEREHFYASYMPDSIKIVSPRPFYETVTQPLIASGFPILVLDADLRQAQAIRPTFYKYDHHWTHWGAYTAYVSLMERLQKTYPQLSALPLRSMNIERKYAENGLSKLLFLGNYLKEQSDYYSPIHPLATAIKNDWYSTGNAKYPTILITSDSFPGQGLASWMAESAKELYYYRQTFPKDLKKITAIHHPNIVIQMFQDRELLNNSPDAFYLD